MRISDWSSDVCLPICENAAPASPLHVIPHLDEVAVGIAEVDRADGAFGAGGFDRAELDVDAAAPQVLDKGLQRQARHQAELGAAGHRSEEHTSELQSLMRISYAVFCLKKKNQTTYTTYTPLI